MEAVRIEPTEIFHNEMTLREVAGHGAARDLGERAALEVIRNLPMGPSERALLLGDDRDAERLVIVDPEKLILLTTWDYLRQLEEAQRIQSADAVIAAVREAGRNPPIRDLWSQHDPAVRDAVKAIIARTREPGTPERRTRPYRFRFLPGRRSYRPGSALRRFQDDCARPECVKKQA